MTTTLRTSSTRPFVAVSLMLMLGCSYAQAQDTFFATQLQGSTCKLYRFTLNGPIETFATNVYVTGMTTVPQGVSIGNMNGGAHGGDVIAARGGLFYRLDDAFGLNPHFVQIGAGSSNPPNASPFFVGNRSSPSGPHCRTGPTTRSSTRPTSAL
ncbi:MAG TPA: hypothetical protein PLH94_15175 [Fimbriimonadaceae bacterium]|nr:hypothetical protein [Fimbriimonadaceae bacterium]